MPADRTRRTTSSRDAAEAAFKTATANPRNSLRSVGVFRMPRSLSLCELTGTFLITFKQPDRAGKRTNEALRKILGK
jgi:hypothetical protein